MPFRAEYPFIALDVATDDVLRPCLDVVLRGRDMEIGSPTPGLVDSGADRSVFPVDFAARLGFDLAMCRRERFETAGGEAEEFVGDGAVVALFDGQEVELAAAFASTPVTLLGREDFFMWYRVTIDQRQLTFLLEAYEGSN